MIAHRLGEPCGTLVLTVAVTVIEVALILSIMLGSLVTFGGGRTNTVPGFVHLVLFATFVFLIFVP